jgi:hypothetical protein
MDIIRFEPPYQEGTLKSWVRRHFATQTARAGLPESTHEFIRRRALQAVAALTLVMFVATGTLIYFFALFFWCGWAGLIELASEWESEKQRFVIDSDAVPPVSDEDFDAEFRREFGGE